METQLQESLLTTCEKTLKSLILTIFKLIFKLKQWPDFNNDDHKLMKDFRKYVNTLQTTINLMSCIERLNKIDVEKALKDQNTTLELLTQPDAETNKLWENPLISCPLDVLVETLIDDEMIELIQNLAKAEEDVNDRKEKIQKYASKLEESIQDIKALYRIKNPN